MKKKLTFYSYIFYALFVLLSCNNEEIMQIATENNIHDLKAEKAKQNVLDFMEKMYADTRSSISNQRTIQSISPIIGNTITRSSLSTNKDTLCYVVNFNDNRGFAIATADEDRPGVLAFIENGNYNEVIKDERYQFVINILEATISDKRQTELDYKTRALMPNQKNIDDTPSTNTSQDKFIIKRPILKTSWGQSTSISGHCYNKYCPTGTVTGCIPTAMAQIYAFYSSKSSITQTWKNVTYSTQLNWNEILMYSELNTQDKYNVTFPEKIENQICILMRCLGLQVDANYGTKTSANFGNAVDLMRKTFIHVSKPTNYTNYQTVINLLNQNNCIVWFNGYEDPKKFLGISYNGVNGHSWLVDGYIKETKNNITECYLHCNWGWDGELNGYFPAYNFTPCLNMAYDNNGTTENIQTKPDGNYTRQLWYKQEIASVTKIN